MFWTVTDQGVFAVSNFVMNVLFARWLSPHDYGLFAVSFSAYLLLTVVHWGAFVEPLLVLSPQIAVEQRRAYVVILAKIHLVLIGIAIALSAAGFAICEFFQMPNAAWGVLGAGIGGMLMVTLIFARRMCLVFASSRSSSVVGLIYLVGVLSTGFLLAEYDLTWFSLWLIMGFWSLICSVMIFVRLYLRTSGTAKFPLNRLLRFQRSYGPGAVLSTLCTWGSFDGIYLMLSALAGLSAVAESRAIFSLANPLVQTNAAMHTIWLVMFAEQRGETINLRLLVTVYVGISLGCVGLLALICHPLVQVIYNGRYLAAAWQLPLLVLSIALNGLTAMITSLYKAHGHLWMGFFPGIVDAIVALSVGFLLISLIGQAGAVYAICAGGVASLVTTCLLFRTVFPR